jgi:hypothetical protein
MFQLIPLPRREAEYEADATLLLGLLPVDVPWDWEFSRAELKLVVINVHKIVALTTLARPSSDANCIAIDKVGLNNRHAQGHSNNSTQPLVFYRVGPDINVLEVVLLKSVPRGGRWLNVNKMRGDATARREK